MIKEIDEGNLLACVDVIRTSFGTVALDFGFTKQNAPRFTAFATTLERLEWQFYQEHRPMYAFFDKERIVGYYSLVLLENHECELNNLCVLPEYRHQKIGALLLNHAFDCARNFGCQKMKIGIVEENQVLREWYEKFNFVHVGTKKFDFFPFTCGYMEKVL